MRRQAVLPMAVVAIVFGLALSYPYLSLNSGDSRIEVRGEWHYAVLVTHIFTAAVALILGPAQFITQVRAHRRIHRALGRTYLLAGVLPSALTAIPVAMWSGNLLTQLSLTTAALLWLLTGGLAYRAARRHDFAGHRSWMMRNYALTFLAVTSRVLVPLILLTRTAFGGADAGSIRENAISMIPIGQTLGWIVNLIVVELIIRRRRSQPHR